MNLNLNLKIKAKINGSNPVPDYTKVMLKND